ncbi:hypothetical protein H6G81_16935 [Scytonema hofmannii FACHB-248]|uniref:Uncharacterized protein n=1 Tax=Scytonema hofmannii FACHB-248 TaxID=1842502 RepID=A0ABR8GSE0_9CYAN|nr:MULTISPECIES: hypothetical protein [Nostocales]MBD2606166.1 hypothetical protein [Scytonema hofmannii FACHB-248]
MESSTPDKTTLELAAQDVRRVLKRQKEEGQILLTQTNILFVTNTALLSFLTISKLLPVFSLFSVLEILLFFFNFTLLMWALLPRQYFISPNLENENFQHNYLLLSPEEYQLKMLANFIATYNANKPRLEDISQSLKYATYITAGIALVALLHQLTVYSIPELQKL